MTVGKIAAITTFTFTLLASLHAHALTKVKSGHMVALDFAPLFTGVESGCFEEQGLDVETVFFTNPGDMNAAIAGGDIEFGTNPFTLPFFAANAGVDVRVVSAAGGWGIMQVVAQGELGIRSVNDLKTYVDKGGEKLKIATLQGDTLELILTRQFNRVGITYDDVEMVFFQDLLAMVEAFRAGHVDLLSHIKPYTTDMVVSKGATVVTDNAETWSPNTPNVAVIVLKSTLDERPELVESYLKGTICAANIINADPEKAVDLMTKGTYYRVPREVLLESLKSAPAPISFVPDVDAIQSVVTDLTELGYIKGDTTAAEIFDIDLIRNLEGEYLK